MSLLYLGDSKRCSKCGKYKDMATGYHKNKGSPRNIHSQCKDCRLSALRKYRDRNDRFWKRFHSHTVRVGDCLEWQGKDGKVPRSYWQGKNTNVRRIVYQLSCDELPENMFVVTTCKNRKCVRQSHMKKVTYEGPSPHRQY